MNPPKVSINMCCYNGEKYLREALESIINQTFKEWELVIINDGSSDSTEVIIREYIDRGYFRVIEQKYQTADGETRISVKTLAFQKGIDFIRKTLTGTGDRECVTTLLGTGLE